MPRIEHVQEQQVGAPHGFDEIALYRYRSRLERAIEKRVARNGRARPKPFDDGTQPAALVGDPVGEESRREVVLHGAFEWSEVIGYGSPPVIVEPID